jgi:hypothetical protein
MRRLILDRPPGPGRCWLGETPFRLDAPPRAALELHLPRAAPLSGLRAGEAVLPGALLRPGWIELPASASDSSVLLRAEGAPMAVSLGVGAEGGRPALRAWDGGPEPSWQAAKIWGHGAVVALGAGRARPVLRLSAGEAAWVCLPATDVLPAPRLVALRGPLPRAAVHWGLPHAPQRHGPGPATLRLRAGLACEVAWEG